MTKTKEEFASQIDGMEYYGADYFEADLVTELAEANMLVVTGQSDDIIATFGAVRDEVYEDFWINKEGKVVEQDVFEERDMKEEDMLGRVKGTFCAPEATADWTITSDLPHAKFVVMEEGNRYAESIIIDLNEVRTQ